jgi:hypothetical protein
MLTETPPTVVESGTVSEAAVLDARLVPKTEMSSPGAIAAGANPKSAPLATPPAEITGACAMAAETDRQNTGTQETRFTQAPLC